MLLTIKGLQFKVIQAKNVMKHNIAAHLWKTFLINAVNEMNMIFFDIMTNSQKKYFVLYPFK